MASLNQVNLIGNLTRDPEMRNTPNAVVCSFGLAVNRKFTRANGEKSEEVLFIDCEAWNRTAEIIDQYVGKGDPLYVGGHLKLETWEDKNDGAKRSKIKVVVDNIQLLGGGRRDDGGDYEGQGHADGRGGGGNGNRLRQQRGASSPQSQQGRDRQRQGDPYGARGGFNPEQNRPPARPAPQQPFGEDVQFKEADIPF